MLDLQSLLSRSCLQKLPAAMVLLICLQTWVRLSSEEIQEVAGDEVSLPDAVGSSDDGAEVACCELQCLKHKSIENIKLELQAKLDNPEDQTNKRMEKIFDEVKMLVDIAKSNNSNIVQWQIGDWKVCRVAWQKLYNVSPKTVDHLRKLVMAGHKTLPPKMKVSVFKPKIEFMKVDAWFLKLYNDLAEPMAVGLECTTVYVDDPHEVVDSPDHPLWSIQLGSFPGAPSTGWHLEDT